MTNPNIVHYFKNILGVHFLGLSVLGTEIMEAKCGPRHQETVS